MKAIIIINIDSNRLRLLSKSGKEIDSSLNSYSKSVENTDSTFVTTRNRQVNTHQPYIRGVTEDPHTGT